MVQGEQFEDRMTLNQVCSNCPAVCCAQAKWFDDRTGAFTWIETAWSECFVSKSIIVSCKWPHGLKLLRGCGFA